MNPIGLAAQTIPGLDPVATVEIAAAAGFDMVGLTIEPATWQPATTVAVRHALAETGLIAIDAEVIRIRDRFTDAFAKLLDIAGAIGVRHALCVSFQPDRSATVETLAAIAAHAASVGVRPILEFGAFSAVARLQDALSIAAAVPGLAILVDPLHLARSGGRPVDIRAAPLDVLPYAQFCDGGPEPDDISPAALLDEARLARWDIGTGTLPLRGVLDALPRGIALSNEVRSTALEHVWPDPLDHARHLAGTMRTWLAQQETTR
jgi:sugar phosphate isomerase/epimerase